MRKICLGTLAAAALFTTAAAPARQTATVATEAPEQGAAKSAKAEKKICKSVETTGSRINRKTCLTADEWKKVESQPDSEW